MTIDEIAKREKMLLITGVVLLVVSVMMGLGNKSAFFEAWLLGFVFCVGLPFGSACITAVHFLSHGKWGFVIQKPAFAAMRTFPLMGLYMLPVLFGLSHLYMWTDEAYVHAHHLVEHKIAYLNAPFFIGRSVFYIIVWVFLSILFEKKGRELSHDVSEKGRIRLQRVGGLGILALVFTGTFSAFDWTMSLSAEWFSTIYGILGVISQSLLALTVLVITAKKMLPEGRLSEPDVSARFHELGNLTLALVMLWMYMSFSQFFIIWSGNLPEEIIYYIPRSKGGWQCFAVLLVAVHFMLPFFLLLNRTLKQNANTLCKILAIVFVARFLDSAWSILPTFSDSLKDFHILYLSVPAALILIWGAYYLKKLRSVE